jgi:hypothetical protein
MSLISKSDVKNHLSTRSGATLIPFGSTQPDAADREFKVTEIKPGETDISISPSNPISPEALPNAQVGGSVGVPENATRPGKRS